MNTNKPLVDQEYILEKFEGKGGWTYAKIPQIPKNKHSPFGFVRVRGKIDNYEIKSCNLMPMKNGNLFLPVKADIRKIIKKQAGDHVRLTLFIDDRPVEIPEELRLCLWDEPRALDSFLNYTNGEQKAFINWIYSAKTDETKANRIAKVIEKIIQGQKLTDKKGKDGLL